MQAREFHLDLGGGLELRRFEERHAMDILLAVERDRDVLRQWLPWVDSTRTVEDPRQFILKSLGEYERREGLACGIFHGATLAGSIGLHKIDLLNQNTSIGYWLAAAFQGRGAMTRACRAMVSHAFAEYGLHRVEIRCAPANVKSCAIPRRLGFVREGMVRGVQLVGGEYLDLVIWGMLSRDWKA